jgi:tRNA U34 2-thiouridine synthase MnmA/TrmU
MNFEDLLKSEDENISAIIRYRGQRIPGKFSGPKDFRFSEKVWAPSPGQKIAFFLNEKCIGNATIS